MAEPYPASGAPLIDKISCVAGSHVWRGPILEYKHHTSIVEAHARQVRLCVPCGQVRLFNWDSHREQWRAYPGDDMSLSKMRELLDLTAPEEASVREAMARSDELPIGDDQRAPFSGALWESASPVPPERTQERRTGWHQRLRTRSESWAMRPWPRPWSGRPER